MEKSVNVWTAEHVKTLAPDEKSIPAAREVLRKGGFGTVEPTSDGRGWWVVCRGITDTYQVSVRRQGKDFACECTCPSPKYPCKHALALLLYLVEHPELRVEAEAPKAAASDFEALLRAVFREPDDDTPRLVFADFLEENGQPDRAALIRLQCEQARHKSNSKRYKELQQQIKPLVAKFRKEAEPLPEEVEVSFRRGFIRLSHSAVLNPDALPARFGNLFRDGWVEALEPYYFGGSDYIERASPLAAQVGELNLSKNAWAVSDADLFAIVANTAEARATGRMARIKAPKRLQKKLDQLLRAEQGEAVDLGGRLEETRYHTLLTPQVFNLLLRTGRLDGARELILSGELGDAEVAALLTTDLGELRTLRLRGWVLSRTGVEALANAPELARLESLELEVAHFGTGAVEALASSDGLARLETLRLPECDLSDADAELLAKSRAFPALKHLDVRNNDQITCRGGAALLAAKHFPALISVDLINASIPVGGQLPLLLNAPDRDFLVARFGTFEARRWVEKGAVRVEVESSRGLAPGIFEGLAGCAAAKRVGDFSAPGLRIGAGEVAELAAGFDPQTLWRLDLSGNPLKNDGVGLLAEAFADFELRELNLSACRIQAAGVKSLVNDPLWKHLRRLDLSRNNIGKGGVASLLAAEVPPGLKELLVKDCWLGVNDGSPGTTKASATGAGKLRAKFGAALKA